jgi:hypothetical protein
MFDSQFSDLSQFFPSLLSLGNDDDDVVSPPTTKTSSSRSSSSSSISSSPTSRPGQQGSVTKPKGDVPIAAKPKVAREKVVVKDITEANRGGDLTVETGTGPTQMRP